MKKYQFWIAATALMSVCALASAGEVTTLEAIHKTGEENVMLQNENKKIVIAFFEEFAQGRTDEAFKRVSDDVAWWVPGTLPFSGTKTKAQYMQVVNAIRNGFPNGIQFTVKSLIAEGDRVAAEVESLGNHVNGKTYNNRYHFLIVLRDGLFVEVKEYMDTLHLYQLIQK